MADKRVLEPGVVLEINEYDEVFIIPKEMKKFIYDKEYEQDYHLTLKKDSGDVQYYVHVSKKYQDKIAIMNVIARIVRPETQESELIALYYSDNYVYSTLQTDMFKNTTVHNTIVQIAAQYATNSYEGENVECVENQFKDNVIPFGLVLTANTIKIPKDKSYWAWMAADLPEEDFNKVMGVEPSELPGIEDKSDIQNK